jgi:hypothetical protein
MKRKTISKKTRFEVFKRDSFKCQYCGKSAPDVILVVDHIIPVAKGGGNDIVNLITSCEECNQGKSDRQLSDQSILAKQRSQLEEINIRREQIKMMAEWRQGLKSLQDDQVEIFSSIFLDRTGYSINARGKEDVRRTITQYGMNFACDCFGLAADTYLAMDDHDKFTHDSVEKTFQKWKGICKYKSQEDRDPELREIRHIVNWFCKFSNREGEPKWRVFKVIDEAFKTGNYTLEDIWKEAKRNGSLYRLSRVFDVDFY